MTQIQPWSPPRFTNAHFAEQQRVCYELRLLGMSIRQIAAYVQVHHGWNLSKSTVENRIRCEIRETVEPLAAEVRQLELDRLDHLQQVAVKIMSQDHLVVSDGRVVTVAGPDGVRAPLQDPAPVLAALDRVLKIQDRRAKLLGLDAPTKVDATVVETTQEDLAIAEMIREAQARAATAESQLQGEQ